MGEQSRAREANGLKFGCFLLSGPEPKQHTISVSEEKSTNKNYQEDSLRCVRNMPFLKLRRPWENESLVELAAIVTSDSTSVVANLRC